MPEILAMFKPVMVAPVTLSELVTMIAPTVVEAMVVWPPKVLIPVKV